jgi:RHS repeat-associated protein
MFATYRSDTSTNLRYARNRYYSSTLARFTTPDPYRASGGPADPQSWNRYAYVQNDPVNYHDPSGLYITVPTGPIDLRPDLPPPVAPAPATWFSSGFSAASIASHMELMLDLSGPESGAVAAPTLVSVKNLSKTGNNQTFIENTFRWISAAVADDPDCSGWLKGAQSYIHDLLNNSLVAHGEFTSTVAAFTHITGSDVPEGYAAMVVNDTGAFFKEGFTLANGTINGGTDLARVFILLHELAHGLDVEGFEHDFGDKAAGARNDAKVLEKCAKTLNRLR